MQQTWHDGRTLDFTGLTPEGLADELRSAADNADKIAHLEVWSEFSAAAKGKADSGPYPNNRHGRRKWAKELRSAKK